MDNNKKYMEITLTANFIQEGNNGYTGWIDEIPGVVAYGDSLVLAKEQLIKILNIKLSAERERGAKESRKPSNVIKEEFKFSPAV